LAALPKGYRQSLLSGNSLAYQHYSLIVPRRLDNEEPLAVLVHRFDGGWETVAGGMLTLSVPAGVATDFAREAEAVLLGTLE
jgi:hypothetical protein